MAALATMTNTHYKQGRLEYNNFTIKKKIKKSL